MEKYLSNSETDTKRLAAKLSNKIKNGIICLSGDLGSGKTVFVQGFAQSLGIKEPIISPSFVLIKQYPIPYHHGTLYHIDLYRLEDNQLRELGLDELWSEKQNIILIEWADKLKKIPNSAVKISIQKKGKDQRLFLINYP